MKEVEVSSAVSWLNREVETVALDQIDPSNIKENLSNADKILNTFLVWFKNFVSEKGLKIVIALIVLIVGIKVVRKLLKGFKKTKWYAKINPSMQTFLSSALKIGLYIVLVMLCASILGVPMTSMVAIISSCGVALGLALQNFLTNIAGGFVLATVKPFTVGDFIQAGKYQGTVTAISILYTKIKLPDNTLVVLPNSMVSNQEISDYTTLGSRRLDISIGVSYNNSVDETRSALLECTENIEGILTDTPPKVVVSSYDDSSVKYTLMIWCTNEDFVNIKNTVNENIKRVFESNKIEIPYPQLDVHVDK